MDGPVLIEKWSGADPGYRERGGPSNSVWSMRENFDHTHFLAMPIVLVREESLTERSNGL